MGRPKGSRNRSYEERKRDLAKAVIPLLLSTPGLPSMRRFADAAHCSVPTLRHYFETPEGLAVAALKEMRALGDPHLARTMTDSLGPLAPSLRWFLDEFLTGWKNGVGRMLSLGFELGLHDELLGPTYVNELLEPPLQALESRLRWHESQGHLISNVDIRAAALCLLAPILLGLLHQGPLGGSTCRPLDLDSFVAHHLEAFLRAWARENATC